MGNSLGRKHLRFDNWKLVSEKIFVNDKSFNVFMQKLKDLLEIVHEWPRENC